MAIRQATVQNRHDAYFAVCNGKRLDLGKAFDDLFFFSFTSPLNRALRRLAALFQVCTDIIF